MKHIKFYFAVLLSIGLALLGFCLWIYFLIPGREDLIGCMTTKMYKVRLCPTEQNYVPLNRISVFLQRAIVLTEDSQFYQHKGFDWESIERSAKENIQKGHYKRGGSTITQQLAKNLYLTKEKSILRKLVEAFLTLQIEKNLTKKEILERYLNVIEYGKNIYGIKAASKHYFNKLPSELDVVESAFITMLLPSPIKYSKSFQTHSLTPFAYKRVKTIIDNMYRYDRIEEDEYNQAIARLDRFLTDNDNSNFDDQDEVSDENSDDSGSVPEEELDSDDNEDAEN